jgi:hypothetical protein
MTCRVILENSRLSIKQKNTIRGDLLAQAKDVFKVSGATLSFVRNDQEKITGFTVNGGRAKGIQFVRKTN